MRAMNIYRIVVTTVIAMAADFPAMSLAGAPTVDPCKVVTTAEVEQVIGQLKGAPKQDKEGSAAWCNYEFVNGKDAFEVWVLPADGLERARKQAKKLVAVKGLGDDAFMNRGMHGLNYVDLFIKKGSATIKLSLQETTGDENKLKVLGQKAVGRL